MSEKSIVAYNVDYPGSDKHRHTCCYPEETECPLCHFAIEPKPLGAFFSKDDDHCYETYRLHVLCQCKRCQQVFMSKYPGCTYETMSGKYRFTYLEYSVPTTPRVSSISVGIQSMSPLFVETYSQAEIAESQQLLQICGVGYRKALEYLVKDYLCWKHPEDTEQILSEFLGNNLKRIEDPRIKVLAERSTWIGNDETHYVKKHEDLGIDDMKRFIKALLTYVDSELAFAEALGIDRK